MIDWSKVDAGNKDAFYQSKEWKAKRAEIKARDHNQCQRCLGKWGWDHKPEVIRLTPARVVHHIIPMLENHSLALVNSNLISLCFNCHEIVEGRADIRFAKQCKPLTEEKW